MDQLDLAVAMQRSAERQAHIIREAEHRRMLNERKAAQPEPIVTTPVAITRTRARSWLTGLTHVVRHRPATP